MQNNGGDITSKINKIKIKLFKNKPLFKKVIIISLLILLFIVPILLRIVVWNKIEIAEQVLQDVVLFTVPTSKLININSHIGFMSQTYTCKYSQGYKNPKSGEITLAIPNYFGSTTKHISDFTGFSFDNNVVSDTNSKNVTWNKIENTGDDISQMIIYFSLPIKVEELDKFLEDIKANNQYTWFAIDTGSLKLDSDLITHKTFGYPYSFRVHGRDSYVEDGTALQSTYNFLTEMNYFVNECEVLRDKDFERDIKAINNYIRENFIKIRGIVVVAPPKELLKYKDVNIISSIDIIQ